jgi:hypothetical protein
MILIQVQVFMTKTGNFTAEKIPTFVIKKFLQISFTSLLKGHPILQNKKFIFLSFLWVILPSEACSGI